MNTLEVAQRLAALGQEEDAVKAYKLVINENQHEEPAIDMEAALYILQFGAGKDYQISFSTFVDLHKRGFAQSDIMDIMTLAFYQPNIKLLKKRYEKNCRLLQKYPYLFRKDFLAFEDLPLHFYPFDDNKYVPYDMRAQSFGDFFAPKHEVISRNFFADLEQPILAADVFSQYELEYLYDNVRKSEHIGRENHIYLHYTNWGVFCSYLAVWDLAAILKDRKIVYLIEDEIGEYPIDFKERFGIDYSQYELQPLHIREVNRLIWHTQLSSDNGGDYFNEVFDAHPNLLAHPSIMFNSIEEAVFDFEEIFAKCKSFQEVSKHILWENKSMLAELYNLANRTPKDIVVGMYLHNPGRTSPDMDKNSRIVPAIFFQPHFPNIYYDIQRNEQGKLLLNSEEYDRIIKSPIFNGFKYIKTFTPMRTISSAHAATVKYKCYRIAQFENKSIVDDAMINRVLNRSFMIDWQNRLFKDCRLVRFEDAKLNRIATFKALAAFLDLPYTESMTYCSKYGKRDPLSDVGNERGFDPATIYRKNEEYANDTERAFIEFAMRDAYKFYGYDFEYYDGKPVDEERLKDWLSKCTTLDKFMRDSFRDNVLEIAVAESIRNKQKEMGGHIPDEKLPELKNQLEERILNSYMTSQAQKRWLLGKVLLDDNLQFINKNGQPLHMMPMLKPEPDLLEMPLYRSTTYPKVEINVQEFSHEEMKPLEEDS